MLAPLPENELERLQALESYHVMDSAAEPQFDQIVELASEICGVPIALISLVDANRQWFKAARGLGDTRQTPREQAFCAHALLSIEPLIVPNALQDQRFADNPLVTGDPHLRFYVGIPLVSSDDLVLGTLCVIDQLPRHLTESQIRSLQKLAHLTMKLMDQYLLQHQLQTNQQTLQQLTEQAGSANRAKSDFLATMSHEIRTPINAVMGLNYLLQKTELSPEQSAYSAKIQTASESLLGVINAILDISKIEAQKLELENISFDLDNTLNSLAAILGLKAQQQNLELIFDVSASVPRLLCGDSLRLEQVLMNLLSNAIKFTPKGKITLTITDQNSTPETAYLTFSVSDTGVGISKSQQKRLFQAFSQADLSTTRLYGGTGLGLSIASHLVTLMGGHLQCVSASGKGSLFEFSLALPRQSQSDSADQSLEGKTVLLIENQLSYTERLTDYLIHFGMQVTGVDSAEQALGLLSLPSQQNFDLILLASQFLETETDALITDIQALSSSSGSHLMVLGVEQIAAHSGPTRKTVARTLYLPITQSSLYAQLLSEFQLDGASSLSAAPTLQAKTGQILLVEDNEVNREIARNILELEGYQVTLAGNGREAVDYLKADLPDCRYDLVLMDLHMPIMDGYQATQLIRENLGLELPIIAMTADVITGVRERVLAIGMNDYLSKPIVIDAFTAMLSRWMGSDRVKKPLESHLKPDPVWGLAHIRGLELESALVRMRGESTLLADLLRRFCYQHFNFVATLKNHLQVDSEAARLDLHVFKGSAGNLGLFALFEAAQLLESRLQSGADLSEALDQLNRDLSLLLQDVADYLQDAKALETLDFSRDAFYQQAQQIYQEITQFDPSALQSLEGLRQQTGPYQERVNSVLKSVETFEYMEADRLLSALLTQVQLDLESV